jgi:hypothetical protein
MQVEAPAQGRAELPAEAKQLLERAGAMHIEASHPELPGVVTAIVPDGANVQELIEKLKRLPGVRHAEMDAYRWSQ